ncbi:MAG: hypothetical protein IPO21_16120 [Bacteroidales bacterium]|nr:hypothetical protein [Bacteroidales bacterium]
MLLALVVIACKQSPQKEISSQIDSSSQTDTISTDSSQADPVEEANSTSNPVSLYVSHIDHVEGFYDSIPYTREALYGLFKYERTDAGTNYTNIYFSNLDAKNEEVIMEDSKVAVEKLVKGEIYQVEYEYRNGYPAFAISDGNETRRYKYLKKTSKQTKLPSEFAIMKKELLDMQETFNSFTDSTERIIYKSLTEKHETIEKMFNSYSYDMFFFDQSKTPLPFIFISENKGFFPKDIPQKKYSEFVGGHFWYDDVDMGRPAYRDYYSDGFVYRSGPYSDPTLAYLKGFAPLINGLKSGNTPQEVIAILGNPVIKTDTLLVYPIGGFDPGGFINSQGIVLFFENGLLSQIYIKWADHWTAD